MNPTLLETYCDYLGHNPKPEFPGLYKAKRERMRRMGFEVRSVDLHVKFDNARRKTAARLWETRKQLRAELDFKYYLECAKERHDAVREEVGRDFQ